MSPQASHALRLAAAITAAALLAFILIALAPSL